MGEEAVGYVQGEQVVVVDLEADLGGESEILRRDSGAWFAGLRESVKGHILWRFWMDIWGNKGIRDYHRVKFLMPYCFFQGKRQVKYKVEALSSRFDTSALT